MNIYLIEEISIYILFVSETRKNWQKQCAHLEYLKKKVNESICSKKKIGSESQGVVDVV